MIFIKAILLGVVQGLSEFLPISSAGHVALVGDLLDVTPDIWFLTMLHLGTLGAVVLYFREEIVRCIRSLTKLITDAGHNLGHTVKYSAHTKEKERKKLLSNDYRNFSVLLLFAMLPTVFVCAVLARAAGMIISNMLCVAVGFFMTALILYVASFTGRNAKRPRDAKAADALVIGAFQGMAVFPGVSRFAVTYSAGLYRGFSKKFAKLFSFMLLIPTVIGAVIFEVASGLASTSMGIGPAVCAAATSFVVGFFTIRFAMKLVRKTSVKVFSIYCLILGAASVFVYLR